MSDELERLTKLVHSKEIHPDFQYREITIKVATISDRDSKLHIAAPDLENAFRENWMVNIDRHTQGLHAFIDRSMTEVEVLISLRRLKPIAD